jgi:hypothetical protein
MLRLLSQAYKALYRIWSYFVAAVRTIFAVIASGGTDAHQLGEAVESSGFGYDSEQGIFYSTLNAWQRKFGYCQLYDIMMAPMGMIVDCEPVYFEYNGKSWMIEFWKGQYDLSTGCEVGIYYTDAPVTGIPGVFNTTLYNSVADADLLYITILLKEGNKTLFRRRDRHWWLTGFIPGEFSQPEELNMIIKICFNNELMCKAFLKGLYKTGYKPGEVARKDKSVCLKFDKPKTQQPFTRTKITDGIIQKKNKYLCDRYNDIGLPIDELMLKIEDVRWKDPLIYRKTLNIVRGRKTYKKLRSINEYLSKH